MMDESKDVWVVFYADGECPYFLGVASSEEQARSFIQSHAVDPEPGSTVALAEILRNMSGYKIRKIHKDEYNPKSEVTISFDGWGKEN